MACNCRHVQAFGDGSRGEAPISNCVCVCTHTPTFAHTRALVCAWLNRRARWRGREIKMGTRTDRRAEIKGRRGDEFVKKAEAGQRHASGTSKRQDEMKSNRRHPSRAESSSCPRSRSFIRFPLASESSCRRVRALAPVSPPPFFIPSPSSVSSFLFLFAHRRGTSYPFRL